MEPDLDSEVDRFELDSTPVRGDRAERPTAANPDLHLACSTGDHHAVHYLLITGKDPSAPSALGWRPLQLAAIQGHTRVLGVLLAAGARPDLPSTGPRACHGTTALHCAVAGGQLQAAKMLLDAGADANKRDDAGFTPLHVAAASGSVPMIKALLLGGADASAQVVETLPVHMSRAAGHRAATALLRQATGRCTRRRS